MSRELFARRVWSLRDSWTERRDLKALGSIHTLDSQFELLEILYRWTLESVEDIRCVYGQDFDIVAGPPPALDQAVPAFSVTVGGRINLTISLAQRRRKDDAPWYLHMNVEGDSKAGATTEWRASNSARGRLQDALLTVLGAYERGR